MSSWTSRKKPGEMSPLFFSQCPVLNEQNVTIFNLLFPCGLRRFGCEIIRQLLISFSISALVLQRRQLMLLCWYCHLPSHVGIARSQKLRKCPLAFSVLSKHDADIYLLPLLFLPLHLSTPILLALIKFFNTLNFIARGAFKFQFSRCTFFLINFSWTPWYWTW